MPDVQEVFRMATQKVRPEPGALERQHREQTRQTVRRKVSAYVLVAALAVGVMVIAVQVSRGPRHDRPASQTPRRPVLTIPTAGLSFSSDGSRILAGSGIYDAETGELIETVTYSSGGGPVAFSQDGRLLVTVQGGQPSDLFTDVYNTASGQRLWHFPKSCCYAAFSPDGRFLALPLPGTRVFDLDTGRLVNAFDAMGAMAFSPDGQQLIVEPAFGAQEPGIVGYIYDVHAQHDRPVFTLHGEHIGGDVGPPAWSPDGSIVATPTAAGTVSVWDATAGEQLFEIAPPAGQDQLLDVAFDPDGTRLATGTTSGAAIVWQLSPDGAEPVLIVGGGDRQARVVAFSPDGTQLMTSGMSETKIWDVTP